MKYYYNRNNFMASHVLSEYYKYCQGHTCKGVWKEKIKLLLILANWGEHPDCFWGLWVT